MNRRLLLGIGVVIIIIIIFLYYKNKKITEYLLVVPNSTVSTPIRLKKVYTIHGLSFPSSTTFSIPTLSTDPNIPPFIDFTGKDLPVPSTVDTGIRGKEELVKSVSIYNVGPSSFNIIGVNLKVVPNANTPSTTNAVKMTMGTRSATPINYNGTILTLDQDKQIQFTNLNDFVLQRLIVMCNNTSNRSLYIYFTNVSDQIYGIRINNLTNDILIIDLYRS